MDDTIPFILICLSCGNNYDACYNNIPCSHCGEIKNIRWILKENFHNHKDFIGGKAAECKIENMKISIIPKVTKEKIE